MRTFFLPYCRKEKPAGIRAAYLKKKVVFESLSNQIKNYLADLLQNGLSVQGIRVSRFLVQCSFNFAKLSSQS
jgi:hypothetical protein